MQWEIEIRDKFQGHVVKTAYFNGDDVLAHVEQTFRVERPNAPSGAKLYYSKDRYTILVSAEV